MGKKKRAFIEPKQISDEEHNISKSSQGLLLPEENFEGIKGEGEEGLEKDVFRDSEQSALSGGIISAEARSVHNIKRTDSQVK